jgi:hypothetical protein
VGVTPATEGNNTPDRSTALRKRKVPVTGTNGGRRTIAIPEDLAQGLEARIRGSGFSSVEAFVEFVLARLLETPSKIPFSEEDEQRLRERLRSLGYID